jgi:hypothetical protein
MNDHVPLRVAVHCGRSNIVATEAVIRPKLFATEAHVGIARDGAARVRTRLLLCLRLGKQAPARAGEE